MSINQVCISGNLGSDSDLRYTPKGDLAVLGFSLCVNHRQKKGDKYVDKPNWVDCTMFGTRAEKLADYLTKGTHATVSGRLDQSTWEAEDGSKRSKLKVIVEDIDFSSGKQKQEAQQAVDASATVYDDDIPF